MIKICIFQINAGYCFRIAFSASFGAKFYIQFQIQLFDTGTYVLLLALGKLLLLRQ